MAAPDLKALARTDIEELIDTDTLHSILASPPFLPLPSALNIRDLGRIESSPIAPGLIYTSGFITLLSPDDQASLRDTYGVKRIYDLRTKLEREQLPEPEIEGVESVWVDTELNPMSHLADFALEDGVPGYLKLYLDIIEVHAAALGKVLKDLATLEEEDGAVLFHCTAGKDRTGILASILLAIAGADKDFIAFNYILSRIGVEAMRTALKNALLATCPPGVTEETPGFKEVCSVKEDYILVLLRKLDEDFGGVEGYCKARLGLTDEELEALKERLKA